MAPDPKQSLGPLGCSRTVQLSMLKVLQLAAATVVLVGCSVRHALDLSSQQIFTVIVYRENGDRVVDPTTYELSRGEPQFSQVADWLEDSRDGWEEYIVTEPKGQAFLRGDGFEMIVDDTYVLLRISDLSKPYQKRLVRNLNEPELAFLYSGH